MRNDSDHPLDLRIAGVDAATAQRGGSSFALDADTPAKAGAWLALDQTAVTLGAGASRTVPFRITVPADAASGVHLAGIAVMSPTPATADEGATGKAGASVTVQSRRVISVQVNLPGPAEPELVVTGVVPVARSDGLYLEMAIENRGGGLTKAEGDVVLPSDNFTRTFSIGTFIPGTAIAYPVKWTDKAFDGEHPARVEIRYGDRVAVWDGKFTVGEAVLSEQANRQLAPAAPAAPKSGAGFPILLVGVGVLGAIVTLGGGIALGRRSRKLPPEASSS